MPSDSLHKRILEKETETVIKNERNIFLKYELGYWQKVPQVHKETNKSIDKPYKEFIVLKRFFFESSTRKHLVNAECEKALI